MTKRAPLEKFQAVKEKLAKVGMSIKRNLDTEEYQVYPKGDEPGGRSAHFTGSLDEYDLKDALNTGLDMAERLKTRKNPNILTFNKVKKELSELGVTLYEEDRSWIIYSNENQADYALFGMDTSNLREVLEEGKKIAKRNKSRQNPKCKTIEVKRKIRILGKPRVVKVKRKICNPELDLARMKRLLVSELSQYDEKLQKKQPNMYRLGHYFGAVEKAFARLDNDSTLEDMKESICRSFDPELPPVKKFLKKYT